MKTSTIDDIQPKAVMSPEELERWNALPPEQQLARLRAAIGQGVESKTSDIGMNEIWDQLRTRHPDAKV